MNKEMKKTPISVKYDWENNPKVRPPKAEFKCVKAPVKKENKEILPDMSAPVKKGDGKMSETIPMKRLDMHIGGKFQSPKLMSKYSTKNGALSELKPAKKITKESFKMDFNTLFNSIMMEANDPNAAPPAPPAPAADPNAAPPPPADPNAATPPPPAEDPAEELDAPASSGLVGQIEDAFNSLESVVGKVQEPEVQESLNGVKDTLSAIYELLTGAPMAGAEEGADAAAPEENGVGEVPNMEQEPPPAPGADPNATPPSA